MVVISWHYHRILFLNILSQMYFENVHLFKIYFLKYTNIKKAGFYMFTLDDVPP